MWLSSERAGISFILVHQRCSSFQETSIKKILHTQNGPRYPSPRWITIRKSS